MSDSARSLKSLSLKCEICSKQINLQAIIDLRDSNKVFFPILLKN